MLSIIVALSVQDKYRRRNWKVWHNEMIGLGAEIVVVENTDLGARRRVKYEHWPIPFNKSQFLNRGFQSASHDQVAFCDVDILMPLDSWKAAIEEAKEVDFYSPNQSVTWLSKQQTQASIDGFDFTPPRMVRGKCNLAGGILFTTKDAFHSIGGWDERFTGWGYEDIALGELIKERFSYKFGSHPAYHLWHPGNHRQQGRKKNSQFFQEQYMSGPTDRVPYTAVTALSLLPHHAAVQTRCLNTWKSYGIPITSVQFEADIPQLKQRYPQVSKWVVGEVSKSFSSPTVKINSLLDQGKDSPILLINSDIEMLSPPAITQGHAYVGIRNNYQESYLDATTEPWGFDAFYLEPQHVCSFPKLDFAIGKPVWDYWIPFHLLRNDFSVRFLTGTTFFHQAHPQHWNRDDSVTARAIIDACYGPTDINKFRRTLRVHEI